jgi:hypothetical protein
MKYLTLAATVTLISSLLGCAATTPAPLKEGESIVSLQAQLGDKMLARRLDTQRVSTFDHFTVLPGKHTMELGIVKADYQGTSRRCVALLAYDNFLPNQRYTLIQNSAGADVRVALVDSQGQTLAQTSNIACL